MTADYPKNRKNRTALNIIAIVGILVGLILITNIFGEVWQAIGLAIFFYTICVRFWRSALPGFGYRFAAERTKEKQETLGHLYSHQSIVDPQPPKPNTDDLAK